jgi:hypothetical protein
LFPLSIEDWLRNICTVLLTIFMTGQIRWAVYGGIAVAVGVALLFVANRRRLDGWG